MIFGKKPENPELEKFADLLAEGIKELFLKQGEINFTNKPKPERKNIIEYDGRLRIDGMDRFDNEATYISAVNFYKNAADLEKGNALGAVIIYIQQEYLAKLMKKLKYPPVDDENDEELRDSCGTLCNLIAGQFKTAISKAGYIELEMSHFINFRNSTFEGVAFCPSEFSQYQTSFDIENQKRLVVEISMGVVPKTR